MARSSRAAGPDVDARWPAGSADFTRRLRRWRRRFGPRAFYGPVTWTAQVETYVPGADATTIFGIAPAIGTDKLVVSAAPEVIES
jgi:hypothetical protein